MIDEVYSINTNEHDVFGKEVMSTLSHHTNDNTTPVIVMDEIPNNYSLLRRCSWIIK